MELNHAEMYGIDLAKLREESFGHLPHYRMVRLHEKRVKEWYELVARHTEDNDIVPTSSSIITSTEKNGN